MPFQQAQREWLSRQLGGRRSWSAVRPCSLCVHADGTRDTDIFYGDLRALFVWQAFCPYCATRPPLFLCPQSSNGSRWIEVPWGALVQPDFPFTGMHQCIWCREWSVPYMAPAIPLPNGPVHWGIHIVNNIGNLMESVALKAVFSSSNPNPKPYTLFLGAMEVGTSSADYTS